MTKRKCYKQKFFARYLADPAINHYTPGRRLYAENGTVYSYGRHFPLLHVSEGVARLNVTRYSVTTSRQQAAARAACAGLEVVELTTESMRYFLSLK